MSENRDPRGEADEIEWVDDGYGFISWKRGWPDTLRRGHVVAAVVLGLLGGVGLLLAGLGVVVAVTGAWFLGVCVLLFIADALGRVLPDRYVILATLGVLAGWIVRALTSRDIGLVLEPLGWAIAATAVFLGLMILPLLVTRGRTEGLGAGDVKVVFPLALWLGQWGGAAVLVGLFLGTMLACCWVLILVIARRIGRNGTIAFGPWLVLGSVLVTALIAGFSALI